MRDHIVILFLALLLPRPAVAQTAKQAAERPDLSGLDLSQRELHNGRFHTTLQNGNIAVLTLVPELQTHLEQYLARYPKLAAAVVAMDPKTGRILAMSGDVRDATAPAASVFKIVTGSALIDARVGDAATTCYHGGSSGITPDLLRDTKADTACVNLAEAMSKSINVVFAKLALRRLNRRTLQRYANAFGFGQRLPFDRKAYGGKAKIPNEQTERLAFARTSAGFWNTHLSALHGALIGSTIANGGAMPTSAVVDQVRATGGTTLYRYEPSRYRQVIPRTTARKVARLMEGTVVDGTARKSFHDHRGRPYLPNVRISSKTGTLSRQKPYRGYTWWVGFAPTHAPRLAVAALIVNTPKWHIRASDVAKEVLVNARLR